MYVCGVQSNPFQRKVHIDRVTLLHGFNCKKLFLGERNKSLLERFPHFRGVLKTIRVAIHDICICSLPVLRQRPRKTGAKYTGKDIAADEHVQPQLSFDWDAKRLVSI